MPRPEFPWNDFHTFAMQNKQFGLLLIVALIIAVSLWRWRPQDRKPVKATLLFLTIALSGILLSAVLAALDVDPFARGLHKTSVFVGGMAGIRLFGLFLFRLVLPLCRINLLRILEDLAELAGYCTWLMIYLHAAGLNLSGIITTSAVMTAVLAFSMQDTLGNILGGLALQLDNSIKVGDWIKVDDVNGRVSDIRWRYTAIETRNWETIVIPNSLLMKGKFSVIGRRSGQPLQWRRWVYFDVSYDHLAGKVVNIAQNAIRNGHIANVADAPAANCLLMDFTSSASRYALRYWLTDIEADEATDSEVRARIYAALQRAGISLSYPQYHIHLTNKDDQYEQNERQRRLKERIDALQQVELFNTLHDDELAEIAEQLVYAPFVKGDILMHQGEVAHWLYIIISGVTDIFLELPDGGRRLIDTTHGSCFLGEMGLMTGDPRSATVIAQSEVLAYRLNKNSFQKILDKRPELAVEISNLLAHRRVGIDNWQQQLDSESLARLMVQQQSTLLEQISSFFRLGSSGKSSGG
ncbi:mechanosensitive ion channel family protein [Candidatus Methylobacter oryzae]|uniref:Small-conductance mechanosensitive channel n=1 Tax=Candidatus Methylobacter oryzae TaxID=2497749 RepID=A0ABY3CGB2_9GAMM|nr:mechanosensitive ion channel family protein [Candidatus Methylobacter oryzae]TRX01612.1 mechanosensitive ion channel [Candidatus Methylobacter oryzae]